MWERQATGIVRRKEENTLTKNQKKVPNNEVKEDLNVLRETNKYVKYENEGWSKGEEMEKKFQEKGKGGLEKKYIILLSLNFLITDARECIQDIIHIIIISAVVEIRGK